MKPEELKPGTWLLIRDPLGTGEFRARFEEHLPSLGYGDPALNRLFCPDGPVWVGLSGVDKSECCTFTDSELVRLGRVLLEEPAMPSHEAMQALRQRRKRTGITPCRRIPSCAAAARPERWPSTSAVV